jgi:hypothetical protein
MATANILCLGDAFTRGDEISGYRSYRGPLQQALATAGVSFDMVGPESLAPASGGTDPQFAAWVDASIDATGSAGNNLTDRLASLKTGYPTLNLIIIYAGWYDVVNAPSSLDTRYETFVNAVQSGAWASVPVVLCTLHPEPNKTQAQTAGTYPSYQALNTKIRALASSTRIVCDFAGLTGTSAGAWVESMLFDAQNAPDFAQVQGGLNVPAYWGGHLVTSFKSIEDFNAQWTQNPPFPDNPPGGAQLKDLNVESFSPSTGNRFTNSVAGITPWFWLYTLDGHASSNTVVRARNMYAAGMRANGQWEYFFAGARTGTDGGGGVQWWLGPQPLSARGNDPTLLAQYDTDGVSTIYRVRNGYGIEVWPYDTVPSRGILSFYGGFNRTLMVESVCFIWGLQVQLALLDPSGANDIAQSRYGAACGADFTSTLGGKHYDKFGFPYNVMDGGHDRWKRLANTTEWQWLTCVSLGSTNSGNPTHHWHDPGTPPPLANWSPPTPYNNPPGSSVTSTQIRATPPPLPAYVSGSGNGWAASDYWVNGSGVISILWTAQGAEKAAREIAARIVATGVLSAFSTLPGGGGGGGDPVVPPSLLPNLPAQPNVFARLTGSDTTVAPRAWSSDGSGNPDSAPLWPAETTPTVLTVTVGAAVSGSVLAAGTPAPTYSIVSGPVWLSVNSTTGAFSGTAPTVVGNSVAVIRATSTLGTADLTLTVSVVDTLSVVTTSLPPAIQGQQYSATVVLSGPEPLALSATGLPAGLALFGRVVSGIPTNSAGGTAIFTVTAQGGATATRTIVIAGGAAGDPPVVTTTSLAAGTVGTAYSQTLTATGATPITWSVTGALPPGLSRSGAAISGTPTAPGSWQITATATNAFGSASRVLTISAVAAAQVARRTSPWAKWIKR